MADDIDMTPSSDTPSMATAPPPDQTSQAATPDQAQQDISGLEQNNQAISKWMTSFAEQRAQSSKFHQDQMAPLMQELQQMRDTPEEAPPEMPPVQQISESHKGNLSEGIFNMLKFGALLGITYGLAGRHGGAASKAAIGAAIQGYVEGKNRTRDTALKVWEKNNSLMEKSFTERNQRWRDMMADKHLKLQETMDLLNKEAQEWQYDRMAEATENRNVMEAQRAIQSNERLIKDYKAQQQKMREALWDALGKGKDAADYKQRLVAKHGREPANEAELYKWMEEYTPEQHIDDVAKEKASAAKLKKASELQAAQEQKDKAAEEKLRTKHPGGTKDNPLGLNLD